MQGRRSHPSRTQLLVNYNTIVESPLQAAYSPRRNIYTPQKPRPSLPLKQFQDYFGKVKPSFFQELKNIFSNASMEETHSASLEQPCCQIQGGILTARTRNIKRRRAGSESNNFQIESMKTQDIYRKAKLNRLLRFDSALQQQTINDSAATQILRESTSIVRELKEAIQQQRRTVTPSPTPSRRSFFIARSIEKETLLSHVNPNGKDSFLILDLHKCVASLHRIRIKVSPHVSYFNVYIEEGNNSELLKQLVRKRTGWRVVQIPAIANFIWTQFYKSSVLKKRLTKREKTESEEDSQALRHSAFKTGRSVLPDSIPASTKPSESTFVGEFRKLVPSSEAEDITKMKIALRQITEITINHNVLLHNHFPLNRCISDKKNLLSNLTLHLSQHNRNVFDYLPESYELTDMKHPVIEALSQRPEGKEHWIIKPGENSNRGRGIVVTHSAKETLQELKKRLEHQEREQSPIKKGTPVKKGRETRSVVLQRYIVPFLYNGRKFDIRSFMLVTVLNQQLRAYSYEECYIRTSSKLFDIDSNSRLVHLTNDAVQSQSNDYGKYQEGNKVSETAFRKFIEEEHKRRGGEGSIWKQLKHQMQERCVDIIEASYQTLGSGCDRGRGREKDHEFYFELFGLDFMVGDQLDLWLIEVNTNPAITHDCSKTLNLLIPKMLDNVLSLAVEPIMKPVRLPETPFSNRFTAILTRSLK